MKVTSDRDNVKGLVWANTLKNRIGGSKQTQFFLEQEKEIYFFVRKF